MRYSSCPATSLTVPVRPGLSRGCAILAGRCNPGTRAPAGPGSPRPFSRPWRPESHGHQRRRQHCRHDLLHEGQRQLLLSNGGMCVLSLRRFRTSLATWAPSGEGRLDQEQQQRARRHESVQEDDPHPGESLHAPGHRTPIDRTNRGPKTTARGIISRTTVSGSSATGALTTSISPSGDTGPSRPARFGSTGRWFETSRFRATSM